MKICFKPVGGPPEERDIPNTLEALQELVDGYIEVLPVGVGFLDFVVNEEGRLLGMEPNIVTPQGFTLVGPVIITADDGAEDFRALTEEESEFCKDFLSIMEVTKNEAC